MEISSEQSEQVRSWLEEAGAIALEDRSSVQMRLKADRSPVTETEYRIQSYLVERIRARFPGQGVVSEESARQQPGSEYTWALDPIDGTRPYLRGLPGWGISLGLLHQGQAQAGFFYLPATREMYWSSPEGALWNGQLLPSVTTRAYDDPLCFLAVPSNAHQYYQIGYHRLQAFGSTALHLACVARGIAVGALTRRVYLWDIAGLLPILNQTGAICEYLSGAPLDLQALLSGERTPEPLLVARPEFLARLRQSIRRKAPAGE